MPDHDPCKPILRDEGYGTAAFEGTASIDPTSQEASKERTSKKQDTEAQAIKRAEKWMIFLEAGQSSLSLFHVPGLLA